jgi:hypothetical protein
MVNAISGFGNEPTQRTGVFQRERLIPNDLGTTGSKDVLQLSAGKPATTSQALDVVRERAFAQLRNVVNEARAALGIPEGQSIDTSPDATADRIVNFALQFFSKYSENNGLANDEEGRRQFADFIGSAINKGIGEARDILQGLQVLSGNVNNQIDETADIISRRLEDFVANGL